MKKACVIGYPIAHSRSPLIHNYWLKQHGIEGLYEKREVKPEDLADFLTHLDAHGYAGCNVTIPHKEAAIPLVGKMDDIVRRTGSLNTIYLDSGIISATSSDGEGFYQNLVATVPGLDLKGQTAVILGAGGSARAIIERLLRTDLARVKILNRTEARAQELCNIFGTRVQWLAPDRFGIESASARLLVNTTSQGMKGQPALQLDLSALPASCIVADIVYVPLKTDLLKQAQARGLQTVGGLGMLLHQAVVGFEKWFGIRPQVTPELYDLVANDVDPEYHR
ncbi:shikimate dehydrogenase [Aestuariivirga litoralis]|uniref:shikimate dehydrogenase n=1 Tax=Aestuariivirga litoralis TaxID=2650924 RepID=UPI0018C56DA0|nr:shikimate dehydrogenase [Aestuariivirga litoralis]MBG1233776.1 shikimate dehydrogenase [Aestuariivirga litoralis]